MATVIPQPRLSGLARRLVIEGYISEAAAASAWDAAQKRRISLVSYVVEQRLVSARDMMRVAAQEFGLPALDLSTFDFDRLPTRLMNERLVRTHSALPLFLK